jgi:putative membrane protein
MSTEQFLLSAWDWNPVVIGVCLAALFAYAKAARFRLPARSGYFVVAVALFFLTLTSPVNALAEGYLFSAHMLQHLLLLLVIPPLLLLGLPAGRTAGRAGSAMDADCRGHQGSATLTPALSHPMGEGDRRTRLLESAGYSLPARRGFRLHPFAAWLAGLGAMWVWHERTLCDAATTIGWVRVIQIISLVVLGLMFWWPIVGPQTERRLAPLLGVVYLFSACVGCTILGILITFAPAGAVCPVYLHPVDRLGILPLIRGDWGITAGMDQQAGGLMMWVPACGIYLSGVITLLARWYRAADTSAGEAAATGYAAAPATSEKI